MSTRPSVDLIAKVLGEILSDKHGVTVSVTMTPKTETDAEPVDGSEAIA